MSFLIEPQPPFRGNQIHQNRPEAQNMRPMAWRGFSRLLPSLERHNLINIYFNFIDSLSPIEDQTNVYTTGLWPDGSSIHLNLHRDFITLSIIDEDGRESYQEEISPGNPNYRLFKDFSTNAVLHRHWRTWKDNKINSEEMREEAFERLKECLLHNTHRLDLEHLNLSSIPPLPEDLVTLNLNNNKLEKLPKLPEKLIHLHAICNNLNELPELPQNLEKLIVGQNKLSILPELPEYLRTLQVDGNKLNKLPKLPELLSKLVACDNELNELPKLPRSLVSLIVYNNKLNELPELPNRLNTIIISNDNFTAETLSRLPENIKIMGPEVNNRYIYF